MKTTILVLLATMLFISSCTKCPTIAGSSEDAQRIEQNQMLMCQQNYTIAISNCVQHNTIEFCQDFYSYMPRSCDKGLYQE